MNLPGLLIEYLINGSIALIWIAKLPGVDPQESFTEYHKVILVPIAYVLGMFIDYLALILTKPFKSLIRANAANTVRDRLGDSFELKDYDVIWGDKMDIEKNHPDLNKGIESRSSRDRIARGLMLNLIPITLLYWDEVGLVGLFLLVVSIFMWKRFEYHSRCYELRAAYSVRHNNSKK